MNDGQQKQSKHSKMPSEVLDASRTRLRRARGLVRPGAAGLLIGIEYSRVRDSTWMYLTSFVITRIRHETSYSTRKLLDRVVVGLQLYLAKTFHVILFPPIYKGGQGPPSKHIYIKGNTNHHTGRRVLHNSRPEPV